MYILTICLVFLRLFPITIYSNCVINVINDYLADNADVKQSFG